jgi:hypothetical protein
MPGRSLPGTAGQLLAGQHERAPLALTDARTGAVTAVPIRMVTMARKPSQARWGRRCTALLTDRSRQCRNFAVTGGRTCRSHGSGTRAAIEAGQRRYEREKARWAFIRGLQAELRALDERRECDPDGFQAKVLSWLSADETLAGLYAEKAAMRSRPPGASRARRASA